MKGEKFLILVVMGCNRFCLGCGLENTVKNLFKQT